MPRCPPRQTARANNRRNAVNRACLPYSRSRRVLLARAQSSQCTAQRLRWHPCPPGASRSRASARRIRIEGLARDPEWFDCAIPPWCPFGQANGGRPVHDVEAGSSSGPDQPLGRETIVGFDHRRVARRPSSRRSCGSRAGASPERARGPRPWPDRRITPRGARCHHDSFPGCPSLAAVLPSVSVQFPRIVPICDLAPSRDSLGRLDNSEATMEPDDRTDGAAASWASLFSVAHCRRPGSPSPTSRRCS